MVALVAIAAIGTAPAASADEGNQITSTGGGGVDTKPYVAPTSPQLREKDRIAAAIRAQLKSRKRSTQGVTPALCPPDLPDCIQPTTVYLDFTNYREGSGNPCTPGTTGCSSIGHKYYTCAAAATRNMTASMTGTAHSEIYFEHVLQISQSDGLLGISHIPSALNNEYSSYGSWQAYAPPAAPTTCRVSSRTSGPTARA